MCTYNYEGCTEQQKGKGNNKGLDPGGGKQIKPRKTDLPLNQLQRIQRHFTPGNLRNGNKDS